MTAPDSARINDPEGQVRRQLSRILASTTFRGADRLKRFLEYIVDETIAGHIGQVKEYIVATRAFNKPPTFDPRSDPIVRVQARRLRALLARYYQEEVQNDEIVIELPKGGYVPLFKGELRPAAAPALRPLAVALTRANRFHLMPFSDLSPKGDHGFFCSGVAQEIIYRLNQMRGVRIVAGVPVNSLEHTDNDPALCSAPTILITGSIRESAGQLRVTLHLVDDASAFYAWSENITGKCGDALALQKQVGRTVVEVINSQLRPARLAGSVRRPNVNLTAHNLYLQGRFHLSQRTEEGLRKAAELFDKAIKEDAQYTSAYAGLADAYTLLGHYGVLAPSEVWAKASSSAATAVLLEKSSAEARTTLAHVKSGQEWDWRGAEHEFRQAIRLAPMYATAHHWFAMSCLAPLGRLNEALEEILKAQSLDPISAIISRDVAIAHFFRREFDQALEQCDHTIELNPSFFAAFWTLGLIQEQRHEFDEAAAAFRCALHLEPDSPRLHAALGRTLAYSGHLKGANETFKKLQALRSKRYVSPFDFASLEFALGHPDRGFQWLEKACQDRCFELLSVNVDPRFDLIRDDRRFGAIVARLGLSRNAA